jgi:hypothetical protein
MEEKTAYTFKFSKNENLLIKEFCEEQSNFNDAVRYLIEKEIAENGVRDLSEIVPKKRSVIVSTPTTNTIKDPAEKNENNIEVKEKLKHEEIPDCYK